MIEYERTRKCADNEKVRGWDKKKVRVSESEI